MIEEPRREYEAFKARLNSSAGDDRMLTKLRKKISTILLPVARGLANHGVQADALTFTGVFFSILLPITVLLRYHYSLTLIIFTASAFMDMIDGAVARVSSRPSKKGAFLDSTIDRLVDGVYFATLYLLRISDALIIIITLIGAFLISYTRAKGEALGLKMESVGVAERGERTLLIFAILILHPLNATLSEALLYILLALTYLTVAQRCRHVLRRL